MQKEEKSNSRTFYQSKRNNLKINIAENKLLLIKNLLLYKKVQLAEDSWQKSPFLFVAHLLVPLLVIS